MQPALLASALPSPSCQLGLLMWDDGKPERDLATSLETAGLLALAAQEGEGEIESVDLTPPVLGDSALADGRARGE
ncbi:hypothetical protein OG239_01550 [Streptomyces sp. NBC_00868]|nr:hypothetical protein OG239_01550 [Streptomyces sp. NBC_00868]